ncbi:pantothenate synthetase [Dokdonia pacifica]|uniref:Pantothenate synthetase n=1 Tax=Dokdonia pacifica TaxID=1627892 RepID=A0A238WNR5_9FLAO|nr:pantoate--beta-alanine ligase [Dokdonia pacifica]GGG22781.1 pantothenate synthetase [Dokdonia pacifica]SNR48186.1 pantothenate synthetase [Dokdonia pacifica]
MNLKKTKTEIAKYVSEKRKQKSTIGFVPTMGALHQGHASLIEFGLKRHDYIIVSIFVNPTQFNNVSDLEKYPRTLDEDASFLDKYKESVCIYAPTPQEVYGDKVVSKQYNFNGIETVMEGTHRPGHFDGVGTVLNHLFRQVNPDEAFFGEKDFQQLLIVKKLVEIEKLPLKITGCPIHRQENGLAMSSRNARLTPQQLEEATFIYKILRQVKEDFKTKSAHTLRAWVTTQFENNPHLRLEYFEISNIKNLKPLSRKRTHQKYRAFIAAFSGEIRLIDNMAIN